jgi:pSer/pThr/pTyr-binding forkhead associated (FHA) protein
MTADPGMDVAPPQAWLEFGDNKLQWLDAGTCTIGRSNTSTLVFDLPGVSRSHAMLQPGPDGGYLLADLHSTNGTYVNGLRVEQVTALRDGDRIDMGDVSLVYRCQQPVGQAVDAGATSVQIHSGQCWLLLLDIIGYTTLTNRIGADEAAAGFKRWLERVRPVLIRRSGTINSYMGDAIFAYWRADRHEPDTIAAAVAELAALQPNSALPFRILVHHGRVRISGGLQGESLSGPEVIYIFRIEKSTKGLGSDCVLSESAAESLDLVATCRPLGKHTVPDFPGEHSFFGLGG